MNVLTLVSDLIAAVARDEELSGGLLSRSTLRKADELRLELSRIKAAHGDLTRLAIVAAEPQEEAKADG